MQRKYTTIFRLEPDSKDLFFVEVWARSVGQATDVITAKYELEETPYVVSWVNPADMPEEMLNDYLTKYVWKEHYGVK